MKIVSFEERACGTCEHWLGARVVGECGYVYTLPELSGVCLHGGLDAHFSGTCEHWVKWRFDEDCFLRAADGKREHFWDSLPA